MCVCVCVCVRVCVCVQEVWSCWMELLQYLEMEQGWLGTLETNLQTTQDLPESTEAVNQALEVRTAHTHAQALTHTHLHTHTCTLTHIHVRTDMHARTQALTHTHA